MAHSLVPDPATTAPFGGVARTGGVSNRAEGSGVARAALERRRADVAARVDSLRRELDAVQRLRSQNSDDDEHDPEGATTSQLWSQSSGLLADAERELSELDAALSRIAAGDYGICRQCGGRISSERLEARPAAALCIDCARRQGR
ncbi:DnaK suppressor protein [Microcella alkaliphila]|uniref:DnaK suppressor protein n=1 Tax=Microcella alkaliphila TaxID=279828 RepID=A0A0U5BLT5_9MICO|nr:DnaK suppressor protein [Microcella alkaliphila]